jgi:hypothetical protein
MKMVEREVETLFGRKITDALLRELEATSLSSEKTYVDMNELEKTLIRLLGPAGKVVIDKIKKTSGL